MGSSDYLDYVASLRIINCAGPPSSHAGRTEGQTQPFPPFSALSRCLIFHNNDTAVASRSNERIALCRRSFNRAHHSAALSWLDIDQGDPDGYTLMISSLYGYSRGVKVLLNKGANVAITKDGGFSALHLAAQYGHVAVSKMLLEAAADLEAKTSRGCTPLHQAAAGGHWSVIRVLIKEGANPNSRELEGDTPLLLAAEEGRLQAMRELLRAKADPLLVKTNPESGEIYTPLDVASQNGHLDAVRELILQVGIEGCGGPTDGVDALDAAAKVQHLDIMATLLDAGVVDSGMALASASQAGGARAVKLLLQRPSGKTAGGASYVDNKFNPRDYTPLLLGIANCHPSCCTRRIVRLLIEAGADTSAAVRVTNVPGGPPWFNDTPLAYILRCFREKKVGGEGATEEKLQSL